MSNIRDLMQKGSLDISPYQNHHCLGERPAEPTEILIGHFLKECK